MTLNTTQETLELLKGSLGNPSDEIAKSTISVAGSGLVAYDLQAPAKNLYPFVTPIRNVLPRIGGGIGTGTNWRQVDSISGSGYDAMGWIPEGQRSAQMTMATSNKFAGYMTIGEEADATFEAISAGRNFEDIQARMSFRLLQKMMLKEEMALLGGNASILLGTPSTPTLSHTGTGSSLGTATHSVIVVALTIEGYQLSSLAGGVATSKIVTGADGNTYTLNGGSSNKSSAAATSVTAGEVLFASVPPIQGAVAYAWYVDDVGGGSEKLEAITSINSVAIKALAGTHQAATAITGDHSRNANTAFDGLLTTALNTANNAYVKIMDTGTAGTGTPLTSSGRGSVDEIDVMFQKMWDNFELSPSVLYVNSQELKNITTKVLSNTAGPLLRYDVNGEGGDEYQLTASGVVSYYYNPFMIQGGLKVPIRIHPRVPPGTILGWAENLPIQYQSNEVPNVAEVKTRQDYYQIDWPIVTRKRQVGVYAEEVLAVYAPFAMGVVTNIANG